MRLFLTCTAAVAVLALSGCGRSSPNTTSPATAASAASNGEQSKPPAQVLADTKSALFNAQAVHVQGTLTAAGHSQMLDLQFQGQDSSGTITTDGAAANLTRTAGKVYIKAPAAFWTKTAGPAASKLADRWLVVDAAQAGGASLTLQSVAAGLNAEDSPLKPNVTTTQVAGQKAVVLTQQDGSSIAVADTGQPVPLTISNKGKTQGNLTFSDYGKTTTITAPPGAVTPQQAAAATTTTGT